MKTPIFDAGDMNDLLVFETKERAEFYTEAQTLKDGFVKLFDSEGRKLSAKPSKNNLSIVIEDNDDEPTAGEELRNYILTFLKAANDKTEGIENMSLAELVNVSLKYKM